MGLKQFVVNAGVMVIAVFDGVEKTFFGGEKFLCHEIGKTVEWVETHLGHVVKAEEAEAKEVSVIAIDAVTGLEVPKPENGEGTDEAKA